MVPLQTSMEQALDAAPGLFKAALVALAAENYADALRRLQRLCQLNTYVTRKGLTTLKVSEEIELLLDVAGPLTALVQRWQHAPGPRGLSAPAEEKA